MSTSMSKARLSSIPPESLRGKNVFLRVDFNVPLELQQEGNIVVKEDARIRAELPTITHLMQCGAKTILCSHLGRPRGVRDRRLSLAPVAARLNEYCPGVTFVGDCVGEGRRMAVRGMQPGQVLVLENVRYYNEEYLNNSDFAAELAEGMDIYVNDAFGSSHR
ncbi:phosphoglycerate kinase, partial [Ochromonadaceae sp. CCMP2298]